MSTVLGGCHVSLAPPAFSLARDYITCQYGYTIDGVKLPTVDPPKEGTTIENIRDSPIERKPVAISTGPHLVDIAQPHVALNDTDTMIAGVLKRAASKHPVPKGFKMRKFRRFVERWLKKNLTPLAADTDVSFETWIEKCPYERWRKEELKAKYEKITNIFDPKHGRVKCFVKDERYPAYKHARGIYSRTDEFKCLVGPYFRAIEEKVYELPQFIKHVPVHKRPQYISDFLKGEGVVYATDYSAFESQFRKEIMTVCEIALYKYMTQYLPDHGKFWKLLEVLMGEQHCVFKFFDAWLDTCRMSGEMCTSLGNGFSNLMFATFLAFEKGDSDLKIVVEGDDGLMKTIVQLTAEDFAELGLTIKIEKHDRIETASFCGIVFDSEDKLTLTNPLEVLADFGWAPSRYVNSKQYKLLVLLRAKSLSLAHQYPGCPIISELAQYGLRMTRHIRRDAMEKHVTQGPMNLWEREQLIAAWRDERNITVVPPGWRSRTLVAELYGIDLSTQLRIEEYLRKKEDLLPMNLPELLSIVPDDWVSYSSIFTRTVHREDMSLQFFPKDGADHRKRLIELCG